MVLEKDGFLEKFGGGKISPKELAEQLKMPHGEKGKKVGVLMNSVNKNLINLTIAKASIKESDYVLEIGFGNGNHFKKIVDKGKNVFMAGIDISKTMVEESRKNNTELIASGKLELKEAGVSNIPYENGKFDKIITVMTIYFWPEPEKDILEIYRVLKSGGLLCIGLRSKNDLNKIKEITQHGFTLYTFEDIEKLLVNSGFVNIHHNKINDSLCVIAQK